MQNKKGNMAAIIIIVIAVAITASALTWIIATKKQPIMPTPTAQKSTQPVANKESANQISTTTDASWKTYTSNIFNGSVSLPNNWKLILPGDGSLTELNADVFNGDIQFGLLATVSSPDEKEKITFTNGPLDTGNYDCTVKLLEINNQKVNEATCNNTDMNGIPGLYNYEFVDKNLVLIIDNKTTTTDKILSLIKFN